MIKHDLRFVTCELFFGMKNHFYTSLRAKRSDPITRIDCFASLAMTYTLCFVSFTSFSQTKGFSSLSKYEKRWVFFHPCAAFKIKKHKEEMFVAYKEVKAKNLLDNFENGGKLDAFRHVFAMAYFSKYVSVKKLQKLGKAHEKGNYLQYLKDVNDEGGELPDSLSSVMDLKNNELGFLLAKEVKELSIEEIKQKVIGQIQKGNAFIIRRNTEGLYLNCNGNIISRGRMYKQWNIPKCLIASNQ
jgi:hypothetical protein